MAGADSCLRDKPAPGTRCPKRPVKHTAACGKLRPIDRFAIESVA